MSRIPASALIFGALRSCSALYSDAFDCNSLDPTQNTWSDSMNTWCCNNKGIGCTGQTADSLSPTAAPLTFDCNAGFAKWEKEWSPSKKDWCCQHEHKACKRYDCTSGLQDWRDMWTGAKHQWCCDHEADALASNLAKAVAKLTTGTVDVAKAKAILCPSLVSTTLAPVPTFDCSAAYANWEKLWSRPKKAWCCENEHKACVPFNCREGYNHWEDWTPEKHTWCCEDPQGPFCPSSAAYDCEAGYSRRDKLWSDDKKQWCCHREEKGCTPSYTTTTTATPAVVAPTAAPLPGSVVASTAAPVVTSVVAPTAAPLPGSVVAPTAAPLPGSVVASTAAPGVTSVVTSFVTTTAPSTGSGTELLQTVTFSNWPEQLTQTMVEHGITTPAGITVRGRTGTEYPLTFVGGNAVIDGTLPSEEDFPLQILQASAPSPGSVLPVVTSTASPVVTSIVASTEGPLGTSVVASTAAPGVTSVVASTAAPGVTSVVASTAAPGVTSGVSSTAAPGVTSVVTSFVITTAPSTGSGTELLQSITFSNWPEQLTQTMVEHGITTPSGITVRGRTGTEYPLTFVGGNAVVDGIQPSEEDFPLQILQASAPSPGSVMPVVTSTASPVVYSIVGSTTTTTGSGIEILQDSAPSPGSVLLGTVPYSNWAEQITQVMTEQGITSPAEITVRGRTGTDYTLTFVDGNPVLELPSEDEFPLQIWQTGVPSPGSVLLRTIPYSNWEEPLEQVMTEYSITSPSGVTVRGRTGTEYPLTFVDGNPVLDGSLPSEDAFPLQIWQVILIPVCVGTVQECPAAWEQEELGGYHCLAHQGCRPAAQGPFPTSDCATQCSIGNAVAVTVTQTRTTTMTATITFQTTVLDLTSLADLTIETTAIDTPTSDETTTSHATIVFDCTNVAEEIAWSPAHKVWCCSHHNIGCPASTTSPDGVVISTGSNWTGSASTGSAPTGYTWHAHSSGSAGQSNGSPASSASTGSAWHWSLR